MTYFQAEQWVATDIDTVFAFFSDPRNFAKIMPKLIDARLEWTALVPPVVRSGPKVTVVKSGPRVDDSTLRHLAGAGSEFVFSFRPVPLAPFRMQWRVRITAYEFGRFFEDIQKSGPMKYWEQRHEFERERRGGVEGTMIRDRVAFELGFGVFGRAIERVGLRPALWFTFGHRHREVAKRFDRR